MSQPTFLLPDAAEQMTQLIETAVAALKTGVVIQPLSIGKFEFVHDGQSSTFDVLFGPAPYTEKTLAIDVRCSRGYGYFFTPGKELQVTISGTVKTAAKRRKLVDDLLDELATWELRNRIWWRWGPTLNRGDATSARASQYMPNEIDQLKRVFTAQALSLDLKATLDANKIASISLGSLTYAQCGIVLDFLDRWQGRLAYQKRIARTDVPIDPNAGRGARIELDDDLVDQTIQSVIRSVASDDGLSPETPQPYEIATVRLLDVGALNEAAENAAAWFEKQYATVKSTKSGVIASHGTGPYYFSVRIDPSGGVGINAYALTRERKLIVMRAIHIAAVKMEHMAKKRIRGVVDASLSAQVQAAGMGAGLTVPDGDSRYHGVIGIWNFAFGSMQGQLRTKIREAEITLRGVDRPQRIELLEIADDTKIPTYPRQSRLQVAAYLFGGVNQYDEAVRHRLTRLFDDVERAPSTPAFVGLSHAYDGGRVEVQLHRQGRSDYTVTLSVVYRSEAPIRMYTVVQGSYVAVRARGANPTAPRETAPEYVEQALTLPVGGGGASVQYTRVESVSSSDPNTIYMWLRGRLIDYLAWVVFGYVERRAAHTAEIGKPPAPPLETLLGRVLLDDIIIEREQKQEAAARKKLLAQRKKERAAFVAATDKMNVTISETAATTIATKIIETVVKNERNPMTNQYDIKLDMDSVRLSTSLLVTRGAIDMRRFPLELSTIDPRQKTSDGSYVGASQTRIDVEVDLQTALRKADALESKDPEVTAQLMKKYVDQFVALSPVLKQRFDDFVAGVLRDFDASLDERVNEVDVFKRRIEKIELDGWKGC